MPELRDKKKIMIFFSFLFLVSFILRYSSDNFFLTDSLEYLHSKDFFKISVFFNKTNSSEIAQLLTKRGIIYPFLLTVLDFLPIPLFIFLQTMLGILSVNCILNLYRKLGGKNLLYPSVLLLFTPSIIIYSGMLMTETLSLFLILCLIYYLCDLSKTRNIIYIQFLLVILVFLKPAFYIFPFISFFFFAFLSLKKKKVVYLLSSVIPITAVISFMLLNLYRTNYLHFSSMQNINLINYNIYLHKVSEEGEEKANIWVENVHKTADKINDYKTKNLFLSNTGNEYIKEHFFSYSFFHLYSGMRGCFDPGRYDIGTLFYKNRNDLGEGFMNLLNKEGFVKSIETLLSKKGGFILFLIFPIFLAGILKVICSTLYFFLLKKITLFECYIISFFLYYVFITGPVNSSRYMMPMQGILILFSSLYLSEYFEKFYFQIKNKLRNGLKEKDLV